MGINVSLEQVKELRKKTLIGIKDCKNALIQADGDIEKAVSILKRNGRIKSNSRVNRRTNNGAVFVYQDDEKVAMILQTCETESVSLNKVFRSAGEKLIEAVASSGSTETTEEMDALLKDSMTVFKENMSLKEAIFWDIAENEYVGKYLHNEGQIAAIVKVKSSNMGFREDDSVKILCSELAMQICAAAPLFLDRELVDSTYLNEHEALFMDQSLGIENISDAKRKAIAEGKLSKHLSTVCLTEQKFVKNN